jgi:NAD(P)-dependent dehydrogenase (short-subunit alcohol dehydrogenase family)
MKEKTILITGATSGIGFETAKALAKMGSTIVFSTRDEEMGESTKKEITRTSGNKDVHVLFCELGSFQSVRSCVNEFKSGFNKLHVLINNAGLWDYKWRESEDGIQRTLAVNFLAPFLMTNLFLDLLKESAPSRIINLTSGLHSGTINFNDIEYKNVFRGIKAYRQSKLALILFTRLLAQKLEGTNVTVNCIQPGITKTNLGRDAGKISRRIFKFIGQKTEKGAETSIYLASSPEVTDITGEYFVKKKVTRSSDESYDMKLAAKLWDMAVKYVEL